MPRLLRSIAAAVVTILSATAAHGGWSEQLFDHQHHDFGYVARGVVLKHRFRIVNKLHERVHIASVRPSCPICSVAMPEKEWLEPGESTEIVATIQTYGFTGERTVAVTVTFDYPSYDQTRLTLRCFSRPDILLQPGILDFGPVRRGTSVVRKLTLDYAGRHDWAITTAKATSPYLRVTPHRTHRSADRQTYVIDVQLVAPNTIGRFNAMVQLVTNDKLRSLIEVPVRANIVGTAVLARSRLYLGLAYPGDSLRKRTLLRASEPVEIVKVETGKGPFTLQIPPGAKPLHTLTVQFKAPDKPGIHTQLFLIHVRTKDGSEEILRFEATATVLPAPGKRAPTE